MRRAPSERPPIDYIVRRIVEEFNPCRIVLFGSYANGTPTEDSDVDIMVEMETELDRPYREMAVSRLFRNRRWSMDLLVYTPDEVVRGRDRLGSILRTIDREGKVLYAR